MKFFNLGVALVSVMGSVSGFSARGDAGVALPPQRKLSEEMKKVSILSPSAGQPLIRSNYKKGELLRLCRQAQTQFKGAIDLIVGVPVASRTLDNTLLALDRAGADFADATLPLTFMGYVSTQAKLREEASQCEGEVSRFTVEVNTRKDLYLAIQGQKGRNEDEKRLLSETLKGFEANGLHLEEAQLAKLKGLKQDLATLETQFSNHLNEDVSHVKLNLDELRGLPSDYVDHLEKTPDGSFIVHTRSSDAEIFLNQAANGEARRKWLLAYFNRQSQTNVPLLEKALLLRQQIARLLGFAHWADYRMHDRMAKDAHTALKFIHSLKDRLKKRNRENLAALLQFKKELEPTAKELFQWDINYLAYQLKKRDFSLDGEKVREYFPADRVVAGMFEIYSELLGIQLKPMPKAAVWAPGVQQFQILEADSKKVLGYFYTDFVPRDGKYGHAAAFPLISGRLMKDGLYTFPIASIVVNFAPPIQGKPSLLSFNEVLTLFHEFGHIMHQTLTRAPFASLSGTNVAQDFVEAPSQMFENWPWDERVLRRVSGHYLNHDQKLPADLLEKIIASRDFNQGYHYMRQISLALLDLTYHTSQGPVDTTAVYNEIFQELFGIPAIPGGHFAASFGHLMSGYDAGYYGYLWSEVYSADLFTKFAGENLLSPQIGGRYRQEILEKGNLRDAGLLLKEFLGREPNNHAFFQKLKIE